MTPCVLALDVGGTAMKGAVAGPIGSTGSADSTGPASTTGFAGSTGLVGPNGPELLATTRPDTPAAAGPDALLDAVKDAVVELADRAERLGHRPVAAGVAVPGTVDERRGVAVHAANLPWRDLPLRDILRADLGIPVALGHDVRAGGLAEFRLGAGRGAQDAMFVAIGTGVAGALLLDGRPYTGGGLAGELGHVQVEPDGAACGCGQRGCLETVASAAAVARRYAARAGVRAGEVAGGAAEVAARVAAGDRHAVAVWREATEALAAVLTTCAAVVAPEVVVVGGGLAEAGDLLFGPLRAAVESRLTFHRRPRVVPASLGERAGCVGAAMLAWQRYTEEVRACR